MVKVDAKTNEVNRVLTVFEIRKTTVRKRLLHEPRGEF